MDKPTLEDSDIYEGAELVHHLDTTDFKVNSALWLYISELNKWKLVIASEYLKTHSLKDAYNFIQNELKDGKLACIDLDNISVANDDDDLIKLLKHAMSTNNTFNEIRVQHVISGVWIDALIYKI